jgi:chloramphenicol 3-O phosphotransferase
MLFKLMSNKSLRHIICIMTIGVLGLCAIWYMVKNDRCGTVIILNGPSAVGKSSIMRAFQKKHNDVWLGIGIDNFFVGVLPSKFYLEDNPEHYTVMRGVGSEDDEGKLFTLHIGDQGQKVIKGMHRAIAAYARAGNNVLVDYIMYDPVWLKDLQSSLAGIPVISVGLTASLPTLELREKTRGTSPEGHARSVYHSVHHGWKYDIKINTDEMTPDQIVDVIDHYIEHR